MAEQSPQLPWSEALRKRFGFETPAAFQSLEARGLLRWSDGLRGVDLSQATGRYSYLWFNDMEWYEPDELRGFEFQSYHKGGFVPFAHAGNGDYWCWFPTMSEHGSIPVVLCPHDCYEADLYAPDFASALYRHALEYAVESREDGSDQRTMLKRFAIELGPIWPTKWTNQIASAAASPVTRSEYEYSVATELGDRYAGQFKIRWMEEA